MLAAFCVQDVKETWQLEFLIFCIIRYGRGALHNCYSLSNLSFKFAKMFVIKYLGPTINNLGRQHLLLCWISPLTAWGALRKLSKSTKNYPLLLLQGVGNSPYQQYTESPIPCIVDTRSPPKYSRRLLAKKNAGSQWLPTSGGQNDDFRPLTSTLGGRGMVCKDKYVTSWDPS